MKMNQNYLILRTPCTEAGFICGGYSHFMRASREGNLSARHAELQRRLPSDVLMDSADNLQKGRG